MAPARTGVEGKELAGVAGRLLDRHGSWLALLLCGALVAAVYGPALGFAFTFDDPLDLPRAEGRSVWSLLRSSEGYAYYRPIPFIIWKALHAVQGYYSPAALHGLTLAAHALNGWLLYVLLRRLTGGHWGLVAAVLFITYPFSYQAVFGAHTLFHPLMTACILGSLLLYHDARLRIADCGLRNDGGVTGRESSGSALNWFNPQLLGSVALAIVALWTHESGPVLLPLIVGLEIVILVRSRSRRPAWWPALHALATTAFLWSWFTVPKFAREEGLSTAALGANARFFLQGVIYPVAARLQGWGARWDFDPVAALWPAIAATLLALLGLYALGRRPWAPVLAVGGAAVVLVPAWLVLSWAYVEDAPRLLYPAAPAIAALWGLLPSLRFRSATLTRGWRAISGLLLVAVVAQSLAFIGVRRDMWAEGTTLVEGVADAAASHEGRPLLFLNVPAWFAPKAPEYPVGHVGLTALPGYIGLGRSVYLHRGVQPAIESRGYYPDLNGWKYDFNTHGGPAGLDEFDALARRVDAVYTVEMGGDGARVRRVGEIRPGGAVRNPAGARFDTRRGRGIILTGAGARLGGDAIAGDFTWDVVAPPPGDFLPVLRVRDVGGAGVAEWRQYPLGDVAAPRLWQAGDRVRDLPVLRLPADLPAGRYTVWLSWEEKTDGELLPGVAADGTPLPPAGLALGEFTRP